MARRRFPFAAIAAILGAAAAGFAILQYFHIQPPPPPRGPELRVTYYRMTGASADFLTRGLLTGEWEAAFGGPQEILANEVLSEAREVMSHFQEPLIGDALFVPEGEQTIPIGASYLDDYVTRMDRGRRSRLSTDDWQAFLGGRSAPNFFLPDLGAMDTYRETTTIPEGYRVYHVPSRGIGLWRYLRQDDLSEYDNRMQLFALRFRGAAGMDQHVLDNSTLVNQRSDDPAILVPALAWLTRRGVPENFIVVVGQNEQHGNWAIRGLMRNLEIEVAVIENVGDAPLSVGDLTYRTWGDERLRESDATNTQLTGSSVLTRMLTPTGILAPSERVVVPTRISFVYGESHLTETVYSSAQVLSFPASLRGDGLVDVEIYQGATDQGLVPVIVPKNESDVSHNERPASPARFDYGPSWMLEHLVVNGEPRPIRGANWQNATLFLSNEKGSCPFVFTRRDNHSPWVSEGHVLLGATEPRLERRDTIELSRFDGSIVLRELEDEVAFISRVRLITADGRNSTSFMPLNWPEEGVTIQPHGSIEVAFDTRGRVLDLPLRLEVTGHYRPFSNSLTNAP